jgi:signal transduction histidine kinase
MNINSTQFQPTRRVTLHLGASVESPSEGDDDAQYFPPRTHSKKSSRRNANWGTGEELYLRFAVEDTGCGLNKEEMHRLFTRFTQASPKTHVQYGVSAPCWLSSYIYITSSN